MGKRRSSDEWKPLTSEETINSDLEKIEGRRSWFYLSIPARIKMWKRSAREAERGVRGLNIPALSESLGRKPPKTQEDASLEAEYLEMLFRMNAINSINALQRGRNSSYKT